MFDISPDRLNDEIRYAIEDRNIARCYMHAGNVVKAANWYRMARKTIRNAQRIKACRAWCWLMRAIGIW